jgi:ABC-type transporter Mla MlaB component
MIIDTCREDRPGTLWFCDIPNVTEPDGARHGTATSVREVRGVETTTPTATSRRRAMTGPSSGEFTVSVDHDDIVVSVVGELDPKAAGTLLELVDAAIGPQGMARRIEIDLRELQACSSAGVSALATCARLGARLREGLQFRVGLAGTTIGTTTGTTS